MNELKFDPNARFTDLPINLDEEQLEQIDALIEESATANHRVTREEVVRLLLEEGMELMKKGASLLPYLDPSEDLDEVTTKH